MTQLDAILCDLDGTLISTYESNYLSYQAACLAFGYSITERSFRETWGQDSRFFLAGILPEASADDIAQIRARKAEVYPSYLDRTAVNRSLLGVLQTVKNSASLGLVTNAKESSVEALLRTHALEGFFDVIVTGDDVKNSKPAPDCYLLALELLSLNPADTRVIAIEDSRSGFMSATAAGIPCLMVETYEAV
jgi:HAD superfamily hydrolase (TIGR01509 family)